MNMIQCLDVVDLSPLPSITAGLITLTGLVGRRAKPPQKYFKYTQTALRERGLVNHDDLRGIRNHYDPHAEKIHEISKIKQE